MDRLRFAFLLTLMWSAAILAAFVAVFLTVTGPANAQENKCGPWANIQKVVTEQFHFVPVGLGLINEQAALVVYASPEDGSWVAFILGTKGIACEISSGADWSSIPLPDLPVPGQRPE